MNREIETHIFDIDGTIVEFHTNKWLPGALEFIKMVAAKGDKIIFITRRNNDFDDDKIWSPEATRKTILKELDDLGIKYEIIFGSYSPRIFHDDNIVFVDKRNTNQSWN